MKSLIITALVVVMHSSTSHALCVGSGSIQNCTDSSGNSYMVNRIENTTYVNGTNANGDSWNSSSMTIGNTTYQNGQAKDGGSWNQTIQNVGGTRYYNGTDSDGNSFSGACNQYGCN